MQHLVDMEALTSESITQILDKAQEYLVDCLANNAVLTTLKGRLVIILFFEPSTRTLNSFSLAAQRLSAIVLSPNMGTSATVKGESLLDTIHTFEAMGAELFIIRHADNNTAQFIASELNSPASVINAGDGDNQHPTQGLLDLLTIRQYKQNFKRLTVSIIGDIAHSRVARSLIQGLKIMGTEDIRLIAPESLLPDDIEQLRVKVFHSLRQGLPNSDVVVALRIQKERMQQADIPNTQKFYRQFGLTAETIALAKPDAIIMHPGPMNRGVEIDSQVADGQRSAILQQVRNGVAVRMALMDILLTKLK